MPKHQRSDDKHGVSSPSARLSHELQRAAFRREYETRINRAMDYVEKNLHRALQLEDLARHACFSPHHFHRIFSAMTGETVARFVLRLRLERAAVRLVTNPFAPITEIALDCGFSSSATFARSFKAAFGISASEFRAQALIKNCKVDSKDGNTPAAPGKATLSPEGYEVLHETRTFRSPPVMDTTPQPLQVSIETVPERYVAYVRHVGPYGQTELVPKLVERVHNWARSRDVLKEDTLTILVAHDSPAFTEENKLRLSVCVTVPSGTVGESGIGTMSIASGKCAIARFEIPPSRIAQAWQRVMGGWLPDSGFQPDDRPCFEVVRQSPRERDDSKIVLDICVPVRPL